MYKIAKYSKLSKESSTSTKYAYTSSEDSAPSFVSTVSSGCKPVYVSTDSYGSKAIRKKRKLIVSGKHITTIYPTDFNLESSRIYWGDIYRTNDLIIFLSPDGFESFEILEFKALKDKCKELVLLLSKGGLNEELELFRSALD